MQPVWNLVWYLLHTLNQMVHPMAYANIHSFFIVLIPTEHPMR